jgi:hypothetical protein
VIQFAGYGAIINTWISCQEPVISPGHFGRGRLLARLREVSPAKEGTGAAQSRAAGRAGGQGRVPATAMRLSLCPRSRLFQGALIVGRFRGGIGVAREVEAVDVSCNLILRHPQGRCGDLIGELGGGRAVVELQCTRSNAQERAMSGKAFPHFANNGRCTARRPLPALVPALVPGVGSAWSFHSQLASLLVLDSGRACQQEVGIKAVALAVFGLRVGEAGPTAIAPPVRRAGIRALPFSKGMLKQTADGEEEFAVPRVSDRPA